MDENTGFSAFLRKRLVQSRWLSKRSRGKASALSSWDTRSILWWSDLQHHLHQFFNSFVHWFYSHFLGKWSQEEQANIPANELLPGFMETGEARAWVEYDTQHQTWMAHLDFTHHSLACHLELVNEESTPIMKQILSAHRPEAPPAE